MQRYESNVDSSGDARDIISQFRTSMPTATELLGSADVAALFVTRLGGK